MTEFSCPRPSGFSQSIDGQIRGWNSESDQNYSIEIAGNQTTEIETIFFDTGTISYYTIDLNN